MHGLWRAWTAHPGGKRLRHRLAGPPWPDPRGRRLVITQPASATPAAKREAHSVAAGSILLGTGVRALAPAAVVAARIVVVVAQPEEPDQPDDEQPDVEDAEPDHEDPPLGGHRVDATAMARPVEGLFSYSAGLFVTWLLGTYVTV
jgi:hypothetical protein